MVSSIESRSVRLSVSGVLFALCIVVAVAITSSSCSSTDKSNEKVRSNAKGAHDDLREKQKKYKEKSH